MWGRIATDLNLFPRLKMSTAVFAHNNKPSKREQAKFYLPHVKLNIFILNTSAKK
jgi:hypothetical protein